MRFRKKPVVIEAVLYMGGGNISGDAPGWFWDALEEGTMGATNGVDPFVIRTLEGDMTVAPGDWIIRGVQGELYPCKPDIFEATYEAVVQSETVTIRYVGSGVKGMVVYTGGDKRIPKSVMAIPISRASASLYIPRDSWHVTDQGIALDTVDPSVNSRGDSYLLELEYEA